MEPSRCWPIRRGRQYPFSCADPPRVAEPAGPVSDIVDGNLGRRSGGLGLHALGVVAARDEVRPHPQLLQADEEERVVRSHPQHIEAAPGDPVAGDELHDTHADDRRARLVAVHRERLTDIVGEADKPDQLTWRRPYRWSRSWHNFGCVPVRYVLTDELDRDGTAVGRLKTVALLGENLAGVLVDLRRVRSDRGRWRGRNRRRKQSSERGGDRRSAEQGLSVGAS